MWKFVTVIGDCGPRFFLSFWSRRCPSCDLTRTFRMKSDFNKFFFAFSINNFQFLNNNNKQVLIFNYLICRKKLVEQWCPNCTWCFDTKTKRQTVLNANPKEFDYVEYWRKATESNCIICFIIFAIYGTKKLQHANKHNYKDKLDGSTYYFV